MDLQKRERLKKDYSADQCPAVNDLAWTRLLAVIYGQTLFSRETLVDRRMNAVFFSPARLLLTEAAIFHP